MMQAELQAWAGQQFDDLRERMADGGNGIAEDDLKVNAQGACLSQADEEFLRSAMTQIEGSIESYLVSLNGIAVRERKRIRFKLAGTKRLIISHASNVFQIDQSALKEEFDLLKQAYINNFLKEHSEDFISSNSGVFAQRP